MAELTISKGTSVSIGIMILLIGVITAVSREYFSLKHNSANIHKENISIRKSQDKADEVISLLGSFVTEQRTINKHNADELNSINEEEWTYQHEKMKYYRDLAEDTDTDPEEIRAMFRGD